MATKRAAKKTETVKKTTVTTEPEKASAVKAETKKTAADNKAATEKKVTAEKKAPAQVKEAEKKPAAKKTVRAAAKKEIKVTTVVQYDGKQVDEKDIIASVKKAWTKSGKKVGDIKTVELYIKPEDSAVYYVINKTETGAVAF